MGNQDRERRRSTARNHHLEDHEGRNKPNRNLGDAQQLASRRDPLGSTRHCIPSEAKPSAVPPPPARRFGGASSADAANPRDRFYTTGFGNASADPLVDRGMASLARTGRPWKWQRSEPIAPSRVISFWASPKSELIPLSSRINSAVNPLLIRCYGGRVSPVRAEFIAGSRRGERGFATISLPRGFCSRRGGRRSAMPSQFENPMMISLFENNNVCHDYFSHSERLRMLIRGGWRVANGEWGRRTDYSPFAIGKAAGTKPAGAGDALGRSAAMPDCPLSSEQGLENAQNDKG
jgi:hypothetical protein